MNWIRLTASLACLQLAACGSSGPSNDTRQPRAPETQAATVPDRPVQDPFPGASEVRLFVETAHGANGPVYSKPRGLTLSNAQRAKLESLLLVHKISPDESFTLCFIPHHFFRYFDKAGEQIGEVQVCFCCAEVRASGASGIRLGKDEMLNADYEGLKSFVSSLGERTDVQCEDEA